MRKILAAAGAIAIAATMAQADPGGNKGGGKGQGAEMRANGGNAKADRGPSMKQDRGPQRMSERAPQKSNDRGPQRANRDKPDRGPATADRPAKVDRAVERRVDRKVEREVRNDRRDDRVVERVERGRRDVRVDRVVDFDFGENRGLIAGCPPGLAKKNNGCTPPGLLRDRDVYRFRDAFYSPDWWGYDRLGGQRVYYDNGYLYRLGDNNSILGYIPLLGGALSVGNIWPSMYQPIPVPNYYVDYYNLGPQGAYRYADNVLYRVDPDTAAITSIAALLTGDDFAIGQPMPLGYDVYNVPYAFRDRYYDRPDALYRYSDGYVYQVDPETRLVAAAIELLI